MRWSVCILLLSVLTVAAAADEPTGPELVEWFNALSAEEQGEWLLSLYRVDRGDGPTLDLPDYVVAVTEDAVIMAPRRSMVIELDRWSWGVTLPEQRAAFDPPSFNPWPGLWAATAVGFVIGVAATIVVPLLIRVHVVTDIPKTAPRRDLAYR